MRIEIGFPVNFRQQSETLQSRIAGLAISITLHHNSHKTLLVLTPVAIANQIKALLKSHVDGDEAMFLSIAMQMAAQEAKKGHGNLAKEIRDLIDSAKSNPNLNESKPTLLVKPRGNSVSC
ncbi:hypothetical protein [Methylomonas albis]|uniref:hypothetical protein n=1 Tax=Methylomonas albis TaxID=1854563 RepID=UPI0019F24696|nr:hypothetical protein [Methylomonas albis]CAD6882220.1 hypothetical protein [Methylomonas albis]